MTYQSVTGINNIQALENRNFLQPHGFLLICNKMFAVPLYCTRANIPVIRSGAATQYTSLNKVPLVGDELEYDDLVIDFCIDENLKNFTQVHDWLRYSTGAVSSDEISQVTKMGEKEPDVTPEGRIVSKFDPKYTEATEITVQILSSNYNPIASIVFHDAFPIALGSADFDTQVSGAQFLTASASFRYSHYDINVGIAAYTTDATMNPSYNPS